MTQTEPSGTTDAQLRLPQKVKTFFSVINGEKPSRRCPLVPFWNLVDDEWQRDPYSPLPDLLGGEMELRRQYLSYQFELKKNTYEPWAGPFNAGIRPDNASHSGANGRHYRYV